MTTQQHLAQARALPLPPREATLQRAASVMQFWDTNTSLLEQAWQQWEQDEAVQLPLLDDSLINSELRNAVNRAWQEPTEEQAVRELWQQVSPGVFVTQLFDPAQLVALRSYLDKATDAGIPLRPPYGLVLNRRGAMLDPRSEGYLAAPGFQKFYRELMDRYMRPMARMLFPETTGYDAQTFGFSIQYQPNADTSIRMHTDASSITLNINLNLPDEPYTGSEVDFLDTENGGTNRVTFKPGTATIHRGGIPHAAQPITSGTRTNLVLWLYGNSGQIAPEAVTQAFSARERWALPKSPADNYAPF